MKPPPKLSKDDKAWLIKISERRKLIGLPPLNISLQLHLVKSPMRKLYKNIDVKKLQHAYRNFYMEMHIYYKQFPNIDKIPKKIGYAWKKLNNQERMVWYQNERTSSPVTYSISRPKLSQPILPPPLILPRPKLPQPILPPPLNLPRPKLSQPILPPPLNLPLPLKLTPILPISHLYEYYFKMFRANEQVLGSLAELMHNPHLEKLGMENLLPKIKSIIEPNFGKNN
tara:strand:- start:140 stop:820 length:681 start_codon:yes stop_codon:yes gene_type:complete